MRFSASLIAAVALLGANTAHGFGILGHTLTGQVAQTLLTPETARQIREILPEYYNGLLSKAAPWADTIKGQAKYRWASVYHYVNTPGDNPPDTCKVAYISGAHDVINGVLNMTSQLQQFKVSEPKTPEEKSSREDALKFFIHFMGDIHQPMHLTGRERGGNDAKAKWGRARTNMHRIWDGQLILKDLKDNYGNDPKAYLDGILEKTRTIWQPEASNWTLCDSSLNAVHNPWSASTNSLTKLCPLEWAIAMNSLGCSLIWKDYDALRDYSTDFFDSVTSERNDFLVQKLIAISGVRMAALLNDVYDPEMPPSDSQRYRIERMREQEKDEPLLQSSDQIYFVKQ